MKIGDGYTPWNELPYQDENNQLVHNARTKLEFPSIGRDNVIYKASQESKLYQWNSSKMKYESLYSGIAEEIFDDIDLINGGSANGNN